MSGRHTQIYMTTSSDGAESDLAKTVQALLGLTLDDIRLLSDRAVAEGAGLLARHGGPACALALLDAGRGGADSPTGLRGLARVALAEGDVAAALALAVQALDRYAEAPLDLVREAQLYAARLHDEALQASARRHIDEVLAAREAALRARLAEE